MPKNPTKKVVKDKAPKAKAIKVAVVKDKAPAPSKKRSIHIEVETKGEVFKGDVDNVAEFLLGLGVKNTNTKTVIFATYKKRIKHYVLFTAKAKRLFTNKLVAEVFDKNLKLALNVKTD